MLERFKKKTSIPELLPSVKTKTIIWYNREAHNLKWDVAQGRYFLGKKELISIELNMSYITKEGNDKLDLIAALMVEKWFNIRVLLETKAALQQLGVYSYISDSGIEALYKTNLSVIRTSPVLNRRYTNKALNSFSQPDTWIMDEEEPAEYIRLTKILKAWRAVGGSIVDLVDRFYLQTLAEGMEATTRPTATKQTAGSMPMPEISFETLERMTEDCEDSDVELDGDIE